MKLNNRKKSDSDRKCPYDETDCPFKTVKPTAEMADWAYGQLIYGVDCLTLFYCDMEWDE